MKCTEKCWTPVTCPEHNERLDPIGRSAADDSHICCDNRYNPDINTRHLWSEHDSTRWYTDPEGWNEHEANCPKCKGEDD